MFPDHTTHFLRYNIRLITERKKNKELIAMIRKVSYRGIRLLIHPLSLLSLVVTSIQMAELVNTVITGKYLEGYIPWLLLCALLLI